jgi:hypothetical protein
MARPGYGKPQEQHASLEPESLPAPCADGRVNRSSDLFEAVQQPKQKLPNAFQAGYVEEARVNSNARATI